MKWTRDELLNIPSGSVDFSEDVEIDSSEFCKSTLLNGVKDVHVEGHGNLDPDGNGFYVTMKIVGVLLCPDAITSEEIEVPFETDNSETFSFIETDEEDVRVVTDDVIELLPIIIDTVMMEAPLQVTDAAPEDYPSGEGWRVISEEEYEQSRRSQIDPRLAKLKEFKQD